ncbi:MAG: cytochrome c biogenesis protein CcsA [Planctomycetota bacterium]
MSLTFTNTTLVVLTLLGAAASVLAMVRLRTTMMWAMQPAVVEEASVTPASNRPRKTLLNVLVTLVASGSAGLLLYRWVQVGEGWNPVSAHVDGLLLIASLLAVVGLFIQSRPRLGGLAVFILPLLTLILAWAISASAWLYRPFHLDSLTPVWTAVHLVGVYLGTLGSAIAAMAGLMYLFVERQLKAKLNPRRLFRLASLETLERLITQSAALGFALLTVGLVSGVVILRHEKDVLGPNWWATPKVITAFAAWFVYALVMNVRFASTFRGRRAAWLAVSGFVMLVVVYGFVTGTGGAA